MEILIGNKLKVRRGRKFIFEATPDEIKNVLILAERAHEWPSVLGWLPKLQVEIRYVLVASNSGEVTLAIHDRGFKDLLTWLSSHGWKMEEAEQRAIQEPYVRQRVSR